MTLYPCNWVTVERFCALSGYTAKAVLRLIRIGMWKRYQQYRIHRGRFQISFRGFYAWVTGDTQVDSRHSLRSHHRAKYKADRKLRTPAWANLNAIKAFYDEAVRLTAETGVEHHVDHVIPLHGRTVCGLHVESNLQVIPWRVNLRKGNRHACEVTS